MSDAPNAIWIDLERIPSRHTCSPSEATPHDVKYIRADLSDALIREAMEALGAAQSHHEARILAALDVSETPVPDHQRDLVTADERQSIRDKALDDAAQAASSRAAYWWDASTAADDTGRKKLSLIFESKALACTENAAAIRAMKGKPE